MNHPLMCQGCVHADGTTAVMEAESEFSHADPIIALGSTEMGRDLINRWRRICTDRPQFCKWLDKVGGLSMSRISSEKELLDAAEVSPGPLALGLTYGRLVDLLAFRPKTTSAAYKFLLSPSRGSDHRAAIESILWRGGTHFDAAESLHSDFTESMTLAHSRELRSVLVEQALAAPTYFLFGQLTSWLITNILASDSQPDMDVIAWMSATCAKRSNLVGPAAGLSQ